MAVAPPLVVLRALGLGDLLTAVPALRGLARELPGPRLLLAPRVLAPLAEPLGYEVLEVQGVRIAPTSLPAAARGAATAVNLHGRGPESHRALAALAPVRIVAFAADGHDGPAWRDDEHEVRRWCRLLRESGIDADPADLRIEPPEARVPAAAHGATVVHPGAASGARRWPASRWVRVILAERKAGRRVLVTGGADERVRARWIAMSAGLRDDAVLAGRTSVAELAAVVAAAGRVVCGDTGVAHLATALGTPSVVLFGPTSPERWGPPRRPIHRVLWAGAPGDPHAEQTDPGLLQIRVESVVEALAGLPASEPNVPVKLTAGSRRAG